MPDELTTYRVLISSPGNLGPQRMVAKQAIESLSPTYERRGFKIVAWLWEEQAALELGQPAQAILTSQLGSYDIYLGIMGARFGSPTERFGSGTEEEYNDAPAAYQQNGTPKLCFFFYSATLTSTELSEDEIDQLQRVNKFRKSVGSLDLYRQFVENHMLSALVTTTVSKFIDDDHAHLGTTLAQLDMGLQTANSGMTVSRIFLADTLNAMDDNLTAGGERLSLDSIWIEPEFRELSGGDESKAGRQSTTLENEVPRFASAGAGLLISGTDTSGKTAVCRQLFKMFLADGHIPVLVNADRINTPDIERMKRRLRLTLSEQYDNVGEISDEILKEKCIVIIDDWDQVRLSRSHSADFLAALRDAHHGVVLTVASGYEFQWLESVKEIKPFVTFRRVEIADLGSRKRYELRTR